MALTAAQRQEEIIAPGFIEDVIEGLRKPQKSLSPKYFYDEKGSQYFDQICQLEEYYPYKTELKMLPTVSSELAGLLSDEISIVEFGAGSVHKIRPLLSEISKVERFVAIDISGEHLQRACQQLQQEFPKVQIDAVEGDFTQPLSLPKLPGKKIGFFPGSTIGNFSPEYALAFLENAKKTLGNDALMLVGVDTLKSPEILHKAYNDTSGVTAKFNLNILERINKEFSSDIDLDKFEHYAYFNASLGRIEMHLVSMEFQTVELAGEEIEFSAGESIHTENSYKYAPHQFQSLAASAGWHVEKIWLGDDKLFSVFLLRA
jgi:dimethylhistidine N-methyltransferase